MRHHHGIIDINKLPHEAQQEILDFYEFLLNKYSEEKQVNLNSFDSIIPRKVPSFTPLSRDDIYDR